MANTAGLVPMLNRVPESESPSKSTPRVRARVACRGCNHRKVRCDVTRTGIPCSNCVHEAATCEVLPRKKHRPRRSRTAVQPVPEHNDESPGKSYVPVTPRSITQDNRDASHNINDHPIDERRPQGPRNKYSASNLLGTAVGRRSSSLEISSPGNGNGNGKGPLTSTDTEDALPDDNSLTYIGDGRGPRFFVYDLCHPDAPQDAMPQLLPKQSDVSWKPHEIEYLRQQGAFDTLPDDVCDDLIRCYFHHVHFFLPVVDAASFLTEYDSNGRQNISLLLFWSMLLAAANFVEADVLQHSGFSSRKAMKTAFYERAKCLYDLDHGTDKLVLIQSVMLMGFWYTDPQDHTGTWYWIGVAITLSQALGLHRCPQVNNRSQRLPEKQQPLIRRIWWSCVVRDRWLSLAKGRPLRIHHDDCDVPTPGAADILNDLDAVPKRTRDKFVPPDSEILAKMWINLVRISDNLGKILRIHYRVNGPKAIDEDIHNSADELRDCLTQVDLKYDTSILVHLHVHHVELFYEATVAVLFRPYVLSGPSESQSYAFEQAHVAASSTNSILEKIIGLNAVHLLKPMVITSLIPAMQIHLFDCKSTSPLRRGLGKNKLNLCMLVLSQLRDTYWSASVIYRLFERAQTMLGRGKSNSGLATKTTQSISTPQSTKTRSNSNGNGVDIEQRQQNLNQYHHQIQHQRDQTDVPDQSPPQANLLMDDQAMQGSFWLNESGSPCFSNVDQLLSPGFYIPENTFQSFLTGYDNGMGGAYDQILPTSNGGHLDLLYNV
ncbi:related to cutinase transcription factor 1 beta [Phialocephala subalpina]|uniref:Related to cutinase transcription factor 1 beta n=1 Tax=Phialocephala subalpina TaxID=576137 RepID=A0A1L7X113_9HELO|nr:related to cutinase transcription factor 1 beta [Phialocephala subalpina]